MSTTSRNRKESKLAFVCMFIGVIAIIIGIVAPILLMNTSQLSSSTGIGTICMSALGGILVAIPYFALAQILDYLSKIDYNVRQIRSNRQSQ